LSSSSFYNITTTAHIAEKMQNSREVTNNNAKMGLFDVIKILKNFNQIRTGYRNPVPLSALWASLGNKHVAFAYIF
jgi:hypothetical protein